jgi:glycosyltransferase involved in cell wall biosynthesis
MKKQHPKTPIRILHIFSPTFKTRFGGQGICWKSIFEKWDKPNFNHFILDYDQNRIVEAREAFCFDYPDIQKGFSKIERGKWVFSLFKDLIRFQKQYDILHVHVLWWGSLIVALWAKWKRIPVMYESVLMGSDDPCTVANEGFGRIKLFLFKKFKKILAISPALAETFLEYSFDVITLINPVDTDLFRASESEVKRERLRQENNIPDDAFVWIFVGSVRYRKGVDVLVEAFAEFVKKTNTKSYLLVVGPKNINENPSLDEGFIECLNTFISRKGLQDKVCFKGFVKEKEELAKYYQLADVFVFPSRLEGLGNVVLEAMATSLPIVATRLPVLETIIKDNNNGLFSSIDNIEEVVEAVSYIWNHQNRSKALGKNARNFVVENNSFFAWQDMICNVFIEMLD